MARAEHHTQAACGNQFIRMGQKVLRPVIAEGVYSAARCRRCLAQRRLPPDDGPHQAVGIAPSVGEMLLEVWRCDVVGIPRLLIGAVAVGRKVNGLHAANVSVKGLHRHKVGLVGADALHVSPFGAEQIAKIRGRESDVCFWRILTCHLHQARGHACGVVGQSRAVGVDRAHKRKLNRRIGAGALGVAPEIRLKINQCWFSVGLQLGEEQAHIAPILLHEGVIAQYRQVAWSVGSHLGQREHGHSPHSVGCCSDLSDIGPVRCVPGLPGVGAHAIQVLVVDIRYQTLLCHVCGGDSSQSHQQPAWFAKGCG